MVKKIEITPYLASLINLEGFQTHPGANIILMTGTTPFADENFSMSNFKPKSLRVTNYTKVNDIYENYSDGVPDEAHGGIIQSFVPETYELTFSIYGIPSFTATATATITTDSYSVTNLITSGILNLTNGNWASFFKTEDPQYRYSLGVANVNIKINVLKDGVVYERTVSEAAYLDFYNIDDILVKWRGRRIYAEGNALSTYADVARKSGTATWFFGRAWFTSHWDNRRQYVFIGTVGLPGSGADLELNDLEIVQGKTYGINNLRIKLPTVFEY